MIEGVPVCVHVTLSCELELELAAVLETEVISAGEPLSEALASRS